jgi:dephospho-CoA kinase
LEFNNDKNKNMDEFERFVKSNMDREHKAKLFDIDKANKEQNDKLNSEIAKLHRDIMDLKET